MNEDIELYAKAVKQLRQLGLDVVQCDKCNVPIVIGLKGDVRNYLYPAPDYFADHLPEMEVLCHDCYLEAKIEDQAARDGCVSCGEPVESSKFQNEYGFLCNKCVFGVDDRGRRAEDMKLTKEQDRNLLEAAEEFFDYSPCLHCRHYFDDEDEDSERFNEPSACSAFPEGIPEEIFFGHNLHKEPYPGDHGIMFADIDEE